MRTTAAGMCAAARKFFARVPSGSAGADDGMDCVPDARSRHVGGAGARAVVNGPARAARNERGTSRGGPPDAGWSGRVGCCHFERFGFRIAQNGPYGGMFEPGPAPQAGLLPASGHFLAACKSVSRTRHLVIRAGGLRRCRLAARCDRRRHAVIRPSLQAPVVAAACLLRCG